MQGRWKDDNERLCVMEHRLRRKSFPPLSRLKLWTASSAGRRYTEPLGLCVKVAGRDVFYGCMGKF